MPNHSLVYRLLWSLISQLGRNLVSIALLTSFMKRLIHFTYEETLNQGSNMRGVLHFTEKGNKEMQGKKGKKRADLSVSLYVTVSL